MLCERLQPKLASLGVVDRFVVAYSGGLDSTVLLHCLAQLYPKQTCAVHIHHGLSENAAAWVASCAAFCQHLTIPFYPRFIDVHPEPGESLEAVARTGRYAEFMHFMAEHTVLLTAHNQDDQAETVLLQLFRGAGPKGLSAMPAVTAFGAGQHARPLLDVSRAELTAYAEAQGLSWVEDESNQHERFDRNYLRHQVMPAIRARWPSVGTTIGRSARHCASACQVLAEQTERDLSAVKCDERNSLFVNALSVLSQAAQRHVLRSWIEQNGYRLPSTAQLESMREQMISASGDRQPRVTLSDCDVRRYRNEIFLIPAAENHDAARVLEWDLSVMDQLELPAGLGTLRREQLQTHPRPARVQVRFRQGGERAKLPGRAGQRTLKNLFQEWGVPVWLRDRVPLIYRDGQLIEAVGYAAFDVTEPVSSS